MVMVFLEKSTSFHCSPVDVFFYVLVLVLVLTLRGRTAEKNKSPKTIAVSGPFVELLARFELATSSLPMGFLLC